MQISALKISDGFTVVMEKKSTLHSGSDPSTAFCFPSLVNKAAESTGKAQDQHCSAELHLGLESSRARMGTGEQHHRNKKPPCITPGRQKSPRTPRATRRYRHSQEEATCTIQRASCSPGAHGCGANIAHGVLSFRSPDLHRQILSEFTRKLHLEALCIPGHPLLNDCC